MDYRDLLTKYIANVIECEGVDFIPSDGDDLFDEMELAELRRLSDASADHWRHSCTQCGWSGRSFHECQADL